MTGYEEYVCREFSGELVEALRKLATEELMLLGMVIYFVVFVILVFGPPLIMLFRHKKRNDPGEDGHHGHSNFLKH